MKELKPALLLFIVLTVICGGIYPALVTGIGSLLFPRQAAGSFVTDHSNRVVGSTLLGQPFSEPKYFWPRPSATGEFAYNPLASGGANAGPTNPAFLKTVEDRMKPSAPPGLPATFRPTWCSPRRAASIPIFLPRRRRSRPPGSPRPGISVSKRSGS